MTDDDLDIKALLQSALAEHPLPTGFSQRVMDRVAAAKTVVELARLIGVAPMQGMSPPTPRDDDDPDDDKGRP